MAFPGWLTFGGNEVINIDRTLAYAKTIVPRLDVQAPDWCDVHRVFGQAPYTTPQNDNAPWYDPSVPDSHGFIGLYPLSVDGLDNDTRSADVVEGTFDGGYVSKPRRKTREVRISGLLIGEDQGCCDYGLFWLKAILDSDLREVSYGRPDPGTETMASIPDTCGSERGDIQFLAACPELGCGLHCGHNASGADVAHPVDLSKIQATSGTYQQIGGQWTFTPADEDSVLRTPLLPDGETCPVRYVWELSGLPGALVTGYGIRDGRYAYKSDSLDQYTRRNLATNPQWKTSSGTTEVRRNLAINPSMRKLTATAVTVTNRHANPRAGVDLSGFVISSGGGTSALTRIATGGPLASVPTYIQQKWSVAATSSSAASGPYTGYGSITGGVHEMTVVAAERLYLGVYARTNTDGQQWRPLINFYNSSDVQVGSSVPGVTVDMVANAWTKMELSVTVPATAVAARVYVAANGGTLMPVNGILSTSAWMIVRDQHATPYFDGGMAQRGGQTFAWLGTAHASASVATGFENVARTNTVPNPVLTSNLNGWAENGGDSQVLFSRVTNPNLSIAGNVIPAYARLLFGPVGTGAPSGTGFVVGPVFNGQSDYPVVVQPGQPTTFSAYVRSNVFDRTCSLVISYYGSGQYKIPASPTSPDTHSAEFHVGSGSAGDWTRLSVTAVPPNGTDHAVITIFCNGGANWKNNDTLDATAVMAEMTDKVSTYFDGATPSTAGVDYSWASSSGSSQSFARNRVTGLEIVARTNYALNPTMISGNPSGITYVSNGSAVPINTIYPATNGAAVTSRSVTPSSPVASQVNITGGATTATTAQAAAVGDTWAFSVDVSPERLDCKVTATLYFLNSGGSSVGSFPGSTDVTVASRGVVRVSATGTAPTGTTAVMMSVSVRSADGVTNAFTDVSYDNLLCEKAPGVRVFFSGDSVGPSLSGLDPIWEGAPGMSRSLAVGGRISTTLGSTQPMWQSTGVTPSGGMAASVFSQPGSGGSVALAAYPDGLSGKRMWLRAKDLTAGTITAWPDGTGNGQGFTSATGAATTCVAGATPNGGKAVRFSGGSLLGRGPWSQQMFYASSEFGGDWANRVVDGNVNTCWGTNTGQSGTLTLRVGMFGATATLTGYTITARPAWQNRAPKDWTFQGSPDNSTWTTLDTRSGAPAWTGGETRTYTFSNSTAYAYYRLVVTTCQDGVGPLNIGEMTFTGLPATYTNGPAAGEIWMVVKWGGSTDGFPFVMNGEAGMNHYTYGGQVYTDLARGSRINFAPTMAVNTWRLIRVTSDGTWTFYIDNVTQYTDSTPVNWSWQQAINIGSGSNPGGDPFGGDVAEILIRDRVSTATEASYLINYFNTEHGLTVAGGATPPISNLLFYGVGDSVASAGNYYSGSLQIRQIAGTPVAANTALVQAYFYDASANAIPNDSTPCVTPVLVTVTNEWQQVELTSSLVAPAGTASVRIVCTAAGTWADPNARIEVGDVIWEKVGATGADAGPFFDGNTIDTADLDYAWSSTADASASVANGTTVVSGGASTTPPVYRSVTHATTGYSVVLPSAGAYVEPVHGPEPGMNGMTAGQPAVIAFDAFQGSGHMSVRLYFSLGGAPDYLEQVITAPTNERVEVSFTVPSGTVTAYWRIVNTDGDTVYVSRVVIEAGVPTSGAFFDGSIPPAEWDGPPDASTSTLSPEPITVLLPQGEYNDGQPSYGAITSESTVVVNAVTAYYYEPPSVATQKTKYTRTLKAATCIEGPTITQEFASSNAVLKQVEFTIVCPDPWAYGQEVTAASVVDGTAAYVASGVTVTSYTPGTYDLTCYAEDVAYVPTDPNCGTIPRPPRPDPVQPCAASAINRGLLFFIPPTLLEERAGTYPRLIMQKQALNRDQTVVRCWPLPSAGASLDDISACDTRGWLTIGDIASDRGFILDCAARRGTLTGVPVTGGTLALEATHFIYPPISVPYTAGSDYDVIPLTWPEMYGGNYGYFILVEYSASAAMSCDLLLVTRR